MIDDITLYSISRPSGSDHLSFEPGIRNDIVIQFRGPVDISRDSLSIHDIELLDEAGLDWRIREFRESTVDSSHPIPSNEKSQTRRRVRR